MKSKQLIPAILICLFSFNISAIASKAIEAEKVNTDVKEDNSKIAASLLISRLNEIQAMTKRDLSSSEKSTLKKEVRGIKQELSKMSGGIYLSVGVLILILILIIIL